MDASMAHPAVSDALSVSDDISQYIIQRIRQWTATIELISDGAHLRKGQPAASLPRTPDLSFRNDTTLGHSSFTSHHQRTPVSRRCLTPNSNVLGAFRSFSRSPSPVGSQQAQDEYRRLNSVVVLYDGDAQQQLTTVHTEIRHAQAGVHKHKQTKTKLSPPSPTASEDRVLKLLAQLSDDIETAAFRLLQRGDAVKEFQNAASIFRDLKHILETDWTSHIRLATPPPPPPQALEPLVQKLPAAPAEPSILAKNVTTINDLEVDDDEDDEEILLPKIRLTSRMAAR